MVPSTAILFLAVGFGLLWRLSKGGDDEEPLSLIRVVAAFTAIVAITDLVVIFTNTASSIDMLFWPSFPADESMSPATAMCFLLAAGALALIANGRKTADFRFVTLATAGLLIAMIALVGYAFDAKVLYQVSAFSSMSLYTATCFVAVFASALLMRPEIGWVAILLAPGSGSAGARRLFPLVLLLPFILCFAALAALKADLFDVNFSFCLLAILTTLLVGASILKNAQIENQAERKGIETMNDLNVAVSDRDLLLRELYHRVKNNLQQINALIHMETAKTTDARAKAAFRATAGRVHALGTVHRLLISSSTISELSTATFLEDLCENIGASYDARGQGINIDVEADDISVTIDVAIPLGMLVNEIVTNALKHAFHGRSEGDIQLRFTVGNDGTAVLVIADDGIGIPEGKREPKTEGGTGSRIIRSFVKQTRGAMSINVDRGTTVTIRFPKGFNRRSRND